MGAPIVTSVAKAVPFDNATNGFVSTDTQAAIEEAKQNAEGFPRAGIRSCYNSTISGNSWLGPSELLPNTPLIVFPIATKLNEISWSNASVNVQFKIQFRLNSRTGTIFHTLTVSGANPGYGIQTGLNYTFSAGDSIHAQYIDTGTNMSDADLILWISRIP